ncbi:uncharacterized protein BDW70DRAFT_167330 [Aspergillus foveolatus]|uniref:uncharacterized protein n=1 Tax=Aspergillus foveolatus TaxID=210207 RepID=UPI003CCDC2BE
MYNAVHPQEAPQPMPHIRAMGSVASPILLPISATGPVPLSLTLASDNPSPNDLSAFSVIPISMDVEEGASRPELRDIQPWDLKHPVATPTLTIKKKQARQVLGRISYSHFGRFTETELVERIMKDIDLPFSSSPLVDSVSVLRNAMHDSIIVMRNSRPTTFFRFWEDKNVRESRTWGSDRWLMYLRPSLDGLVGHRCDALWQCGNNVIYCSKCTSYRLPSSSTTGGDADKTDSTLTFGQPIPVGRVTMVAHIARKIFDGCLRPDKKSLNIPRAYQILSKIFHKPTIDSIPMPQAYMVSNLLRDSLFVGAGMFPKAAAESWADCFDVGEHSQQRMSGVTKAAVGVAAGTAVVGTGAMVGLKIPEVVGL